MSETNKESKIKALAEVLYENWYAAEDYGEDLFTSTWFSPKSNVEHKASVEMFEATCYYVIQTLVYSDFGEEILHEINKLRGEG